MKSTCMLYITQNTIKTIVDSHNNYNYYMVLSHSTVSPGPPWSTTLQCIRRSVYRSMQHRKPGDEAILTRYWHNTSNLPYNDYTHCFGRLGNNSILGTVATHPVCGSVRGLGLLLVFQTLVALAS